MFELKSSIHFVGSLQHVPKQIGLCLMKTSDEVVGVMLVMRLDDYIICILLKIRPARHKTNFAWKKVLALYSA